MAGCWRLFLYSLILSFCLNCFSHGAKITTCHMLILCFIWSGRAYCTLLPSLSLPPPRGWGPIATLTKICGHFLKNHITMMLLAVAMKRDVALGYRSRTALCAFGSLFSSSGNCPALTFCAVWTCSFLFHSVIMSNLRWSAVQIILAPNLSLTLFAEVKG